MKHKLSFREYVYVASMLFGMFFGAGNLIFPVHLGQMAGRNAIPAMIGFIITAVGIHTLTVYRHCLPGLENATATFSPVCCI